MRIAQKLPRLADAVRRHGVVILPRLTAKRLLNLALMLCELRIKRPKPLSYPIIAKIEAANACNLKCLGCRSGEPSVDYPPGRMRPELMKQILGQIGDYLFEIVFYLWGEPTLNPELPQLIQMIHQRNISVSISTNLHFLRRELSLKLMECALDKIVVCLDGFSQKSYETIRVGGNFKEALGNLEEFMRLKKQRSARRPYVEWQYIVTDETLPEMERARQFARDIGVDVFVLLQDWAGRLTDWRYFEKLPGFRRQLARAKRSCYWLWAAATVQWNGAVFPCCFVANKDDDIRRYGDIAREDFRSIWHNQQFATSREYIRTGDKCEGAICCQCLTPPVFSSRQEDRDRRVYE